MEPTPPLTKESRFVGWWQIKPITKMFTSLPRVLTGLGISMGFLMQRATFTWNDMSTSEIGQMITRDTTFRKNCILPIHYDQRKIFILHSDCIKVLCDAKIVTDVPWYSDAKLTKVLSVGSSSRRHCFKSLQGQSPPLHCSIIFERPLRKQLVCGSVAERS